MDALRLMIFKIKHALWVKDCGHEYEEWIDENRRA